MHHPLHRNFGASTCKFESIITAIYGLNFGPKRTVVGGGITKNVIRSWIATVAAAGFGPGVRLGPAFIDILTPSPSSLQLLITYHSDRLLFRPFISQTVYQSDRLGNVVVDSRLRPS